MLLGDDTGDVRRSRHPTAAHDDSHDRALAPDPLDHFESDIVFAHDREIGPGDVAQGDAGMDAFEAAAQPRIDAHDAEYTVVAGGNDVPHAAAMIGPAQELVEEGVCRQHEESVSITSEARRTRNILACSAFGTM